MRLEVLEVLAHALQNAAEYPSIHDESVCTVKAKRIGTASTVHNLS